MLKEESWSAESLLVLENADPLIELENHLPTPFDKPMLVTSTDPVIGNWTEYSFHLSEFANYKAVNDLAKAIKKSLNPGRRVTAVVANGGSGKTQMVLKFVATHASR